MADGGGDADRADDEHDERAGHEFGAQREPVEFVEEEFGEPAMLGFEGFRTCRRRGFGLSCASLALFTEPGESALFGRIGGFALIGGHAWIVWIGRVDRIGGTDGISRIGRCTLVGDRNADRGHAVAGGSGGSLHVPHSGVGRACTRRCRIGGGTGWGTTANGSIRRRRNGRRSGQARIGIVGIIRIVRNI